MRVIFLGSPISVLSPLQTLVEMDGSHNLIAVVSQPAKKAGRNRKLIDPPIAAFAKEQGLLTLQPEKASDVGFLKTIRELEPDLMITAAYGQILSREFLSIPTRGTINIHPSLLPKYRGATPVPTALINGDSKTGVTILFTVRKLDAGNVILQEESEIGENETTESLTNRLFALGAKMLPQALSLLADPTFLGTPQDENFVSHCHKINKEDGLIRWSNKAKNIFNQIRGLYPWPGGYTFFHGSRITIESARLAPSADLEEVLKISAVGSFAYSKKNKAICVATGDGFLLLDSLKPAGSRSQDALAFWNGNKTKGELIFNDDEEN
ncbi:MAG: methionyl-tRNA formyltransferase [Bdellovibrionota bacterium]